MIKRTLIPVLISLLIGTYMVTLSALADDASDAKDPTKEHYCDPTTNAALLTQIKAYDNQMAGLQKNDPKRFDIMDKISKISPQLKCSYRTKK